MGRAAKSQNGSSYHRHRELCVWDERQLGHLYAVFFLKSSTLCILVSSGRTSTAPPRTSSVYLEGAQVPVLISREEHVRSALDPQIIPTNLC